MLLDLTNPALRRGWYPVALARELGDAPLGVRLLGEHWVLTRQGGAVRAFVDRCPHRLAPLSAGCVLPDGTLQCPYHGWRYAADGGCTLIPALGEGAVLPPRARLTSAAAVTELAGIVWLAPEPPVVPLPEIPQAEDPTFFVGHLEPARAELNPGVTIDNFCDIAHFAFVHAGTFGAAEAPEVGELRVGAEDFSATLVDTQTFANREDPGVADGTRPLLQTRRATYRYLAPFVATLQLDYLETGGTNVIVFGVQPEHGDTARVYTALLRNDVADEAELATALAFEQAVLDEDLLLGRRMPRPLPLDLTVEVHTRADKFTLEVRRILARLQRLGTETARP